MLVFGIFTMAVIVGAGSLFSRVTGKTTTFSVSLNWANEKHQKSTEVSTREDLRCGVRRFPMFTSQHNMEPYRNVGYEIKVRQDHLLYKIRCSLFVWALPHGWCLHVNSNKEIFVTATDYCVTYCSPYILEWVKHTQYRSQGIQLGLYSIAMSEFPNHRSYYKFV